MDSPFDLRHYGEVDPLASQKSRQEFKLFLKEREQILWERIYSLRARLWRHGIRASWVHIQQEADLFPLLKRERIDLVLWPVSEAPCFSRWHWSTILAQIPCALLRL